MQDKPNIIFIMTDQQNVNSLGCYGNSVIKTPNIDALAKRSTTFDWAFVQSPLCVPSRVCMMTGRYMHATRSRNNRQLVGTDETDLPSYLKQHGYSINLIGKNHAFHPQRLKDDWDYIYQVDHLGVLDHEDANRYKALEEKRKECYYRAAVSSNVLDEPKEHFGTHQIMEQANEFLAETHNKPFFLWLSFPDPHPPYVIPEEFDLYDPNGIQLPPKDDLSEKPVSHWIMSEMTEVGRVPQEEVKELVARYYGAVTFIDDAVGSVCKTLERVGLEENTVIIFTSDHGDYLGAHNAVEKGASLYDSLVRVPFIIHVPNKGPKRFDKTMVETIDIFPTVLDIAKIPLPHEGRFLNGVSVLPLINGEQTLHRQEVFAELRGEPLKISKDEAKEIVKRRKAEWKQDPSCRVFPWIVPERQVGPAYMLRTLEWKYVVYATGEEEFYHLLSDPHEIKNIVNKARYRDVISEFRKRLLVKLLLSNDLRPPSGFDSELFIRG